MCGDFILNVPVIIGMSKIKKGVCFYSLVTITPDI